MILIHCPKCEQEVEPILSESGKHTRADCPICKRYIKFLPKEINAKDYKMHYGKYVGKTLEEINNIDYDYLIWLHDTAKPRLQELVAKILGYK